ncbi:MAG: hypothetical protein ABI165_15615 [Bryobacteraceae bacterium]
MATFDQNTRPNQTLRRAGADRLPEKKIQTKDEVPDELFAAHVALKKLLVNSDRRLGSARCAGPDREPCPAPVGKTDIGAGRFIGWLDVVASKFCD